MGAGWRTLVATAVASGLLAGCQTSDDARVLQVLNQRGFGRPTLDANRQYYIGIGDGLLMRNSVLPEYNGVQEIVRMDGVITLPEVGEVYVNGLTPQQASEAVKARYAEYVNDASGFSVEVVGASSKRYYLVGVVPKLTRALAFSGDELLVDVLVKSNVDPVLVDTDEIIVLRGDPENPLAIVCDFGSIISEGKTRDNILIRENDIIYLTPSIIGYFTQLVNAILTPVKPLFQLITGVNNVISVTDTFGQGTVGYGKGNKNQYNF